MASSLLRGSMAARCVLPHHRVLASGVRHYSGGHAVDPQNVTKVTPYEVDLLKLNQRVRDAPTYRNSTQARQDKLLWFVIYPLMDH